MNVINVGIDFKHGICQNKGISVVTGDYNSTKVVFEFADEIDGTKIFEMKNPKGELVYADEIVNNEVVLVGYKEENGEIETYSLFGEEGDYIFEVSLYGNDSKLTSVSGYINAKKEEVIVDGEEVQEKITLFDNLINTLNEKIEETDNLDIDAEKVDKTTTITITKKDGTQEEVEILDGLSLEYNWLDTSLGIKREDEQEYVYVDLKGEKGDAGAIKMIIVQELPETGQEDTIYLVPLEEPESQENRYAEYVYINNAWELLGKIGIEVDLTDYYTKTETNTLLNDKVGFTDYATDNKGGVIKTGENGISMNNNNRLQVGTSTYEQYQAKANSYFVGKGTLENVITGKDLTTKAYVDGLVGDINTALDTINGEVI